MRKYVIKCAIWTIETGVTNDAVLCECGRRPEMVVGFLEADVTVDAAAVVCRLDGGTAVVMV
jgi:hypothetical protein